ncbi:glutathione S-transferase 1-like [Arctopsyche grandis]|uniref:glutathione S-transferase 1-like n=1 Tax=Arctopsyche grandis TaxID=121162 RepID=UPI00406D8F53
MASSNRKKYSLDECHLGRSASNLINETELNFTNPPRLYMTLVSPPVRGTLLVAAALGIPLQLVTVDLMKGEHLQPEFVKKNPQHTIPMLEENGFCLSDSHAIAGYLSTAYGRNDNLYPHEPRRRAIVDQRLHFDSATLFNRLRATITPLMTGSATSISQTSIDELEEALGFLEKFLDGDHWIAGDMLTIADLCCVATVTSINEILPVNSERYPNVHEWMENCKKLPYYEENAKGVKMFGELIRGMIK